MGLLRNNSRTAIRYMWSNGQSRGSPEKQRRGHPFLEDRRTLGELQTEFFLLGSKINAVHARPSQPNSNLHEVSINLHVDYIIAVQLFEDSYQAPSPRLVNVRVLSKKQNNIRTRDLLQGFDFPQLWELNSLCNPLLVLMLEVISSRIEI